MRKYLKRHAVCIKGLIAWAFVAAVATSLFIYSLGPV